MTNDLLINELVLYKEECIICFELIEKKVVLNCNHHYCEDCIYQWVTIGKYQCPICRYTITELTLENKKYNIHQYRNKERNCINDLCKSCNDNFYKNIFVLFGCGIFILTTFTVHTSYLNNEINNSEINNSEINNNQLNNQLNNNQLNNNEINNG